jgi:adenylate cyclase
MPDSKMTTLWRELLRRKVIRTGLSYSITVWLLMQVFDIVLPAFEAPGWVLKVLIAILLAGLPIALVLAWSFEITHDSPGAARDKRIGLNGYLVVVLLAAIGYLLFDKFYVAPEGVPTVEPRQVVASNNKSIAVLPFKNLSANQDDQYFSDGVMEAILNELSLIRDLKVISRTSVEGYRDTKKSVTQIGQELDVAHVLEGSVQRAGDKIRVTAQLIAAHDDKHLWSRNYDRALSDIFAIQSEIAEAISSNLELISRT